MATRSGYGPPTGKRLLLLLALLTPVAGCSKKTTAPDPGTGSLGGQIRYAADDSAAIAQEVMLLPVGVPGGEILKAPTDEQGAYVFPNLTPATYVVYCQDFAGHADAETAVVTIGNHETVPLWLRPAGCIWGVVTLEDQTDHRGTWVHPTLLGTASTTYPDGAFEITGVPPGDWVVEAIHDGYVAGTSPATLLTPGDSVTITPIHLMPAAPAARLAPSSKMPAPARIAH